MEMNVNYLVLFQMLIFNLKYLLKTAVKLSWIGDKTDTTKNISIVEGIFLLTQNFGCL